MNKTFYQSTTLRVLGFVAAVAGLAFTELIAPALTKKADSIKIEELVDARMADYIESLQKKED